MKVMDLTNVEKQRIINSSLITIEPICSIIESQQPFGSDEDVENFPRALFSLQID